MLIALAIRRRALACAVLVGATSTCWGQTALVVAHGPTDHDQRFAASKVDPPPPALAASTPALPRWPDETPGSAYALAREAANVPAAESSPAASDQPTAAAKPDLPLPDSQSTAANLPVDRDRRRLGPPNDADSRPTAFPSSRPAERLSVVPKFGLPLDSIYTTGAALAIVVGLFLLCVWALRRGTRKSAALLPEDAVSVLGRVPLAARQFAQLVHVGNKLVLLSVMPAGVETLTEITDPVEIDRLLGLCMQRKRHSSTSEFDDVFRALAKESAPDELLNRGPGQFATRTATDAYAAYRRGADRG